MMKNLKYTIIFVCLFKSFWGITQEPFTPGNIVVYRVGDGSSVLGDNADKVFLDEYTASGVLVQSIQMPSSGTKKLTYGGTPTSGFLTLSGNGKYLVVPGYNAAPGTDLSSPNAERSIALVDFNGAVSSVTVLPNPQPSYITSAASEDGTNLWYAGSDGIECATAGASTYSKITDFSPNISTSVIIANGQLYANTGGGSIGQVGTGLPTGGGQTFTTLPGFSDINHLQFAFADLDVSVPGVDVLYAASGAFPSGGLKKYSLVNGAWVLNGTIGGRLDRYAGVTVKVSGSSVTIFATRLGNNSSSVRGGELVSLIDNSGYNGSFAGDPAVIASVTDPDTKSFRGIALVPQPAPFTPGNIVVYRVGDGNSILGDNAAKVFLDEYTSFGLLVQSIQLPAIGDKKLTLGGTPASGFLTLSSDGKCLVVPGYNAVIGTDLSTPSSERSIAVVDFNGGISSMTVLPNPQPSYITSAASDNGINLWFAGSDGIEYAIAGSATYSRIADFSPNISTSVIIANGQLYANRGGGSIGQVGTGLPTGGGQTFTTLPGFSDINHLQFAFADLDASVPGVDVLYAASGAFPDGGLKKYSLVNGGWVLNGTIGVRSDRYSGVAVKISGNSATVFATRLGNNSTSVRGGELVTLIDNSGYNGNFNGNPTIIASITDPDTKSFRGVVKVPVGCPPVIGLRISDIASNQANILWNNSNGSSSYEYAIDTSPIPPISGTITVNSSANVTGLTNASTYYVHVRTYCSATSKSEWTTTSFTTGCKAPPVPAVNVMVTNYGTMTAKWGKVFGAANYEYFVSTNATPPASGILLPDTTFTISNLNSVSQYYLHVRSICASGVYSSWITKSFTTGCFMPTTNITVSLKNAVASWNKINNAVKYEYDLTNSPAKPLSGTFTNDTTYVINKTQEGTVYYFHVRSVCANGFVSDWSTASFDSYGLQAYPSPVKDVLQIRVEGVSNPSGEIAIGDATGKVIQRLKLTGNAASINTRSWPAGVYLIRYSDRQHQYTVRILKQ